MENYASAKAFDPIARSNKRIRRKVRSMIVVAAVMAVMVFTYGVPSFQLGSYRARRTNGTPTAIDKIEAEYWTPGFGWRVIKADEVARGCPIIVFLPLNQCLYPKTK